jgi:hypothetical protein
MTAYQVVTQAIGIVAMVFYVVSFQHKEKKRVLIFHMISGILYCVNYLMLGAYVGGIMNGIAVIRAAVYAYRERFRADRLVWLFGFCGVYALSYVLTFTMFGKEPTPQNLLIELLPIIGMVVTTVGFRLHSARAVRVVGMINAPLWLIYNLINAAIGAVAGDLLSLGSIVVGMLRHDLPREKNEQKTTDV